MWSCRCTYDSQASALLLAQDERHAPTQDGTTATRDAAHTPPIGKRTRSQRTATVGGAMVKVTDPLWAVNEEGNAVQMQHQDIALMTYEQLRKELSSSDRSAVWRHCRCDAHSTGQRAELFVIICERANMQQAHTISNVRS